MPRKKEDFTPMFIAEWLSGAGVEVVIEEKEEGAPPQDYEGGEDEEGYPGEGGDEYPGGEDHYDGDGDMGAYDD